MTSPKIRKAAFHRNGVSGAPFAVAIVDDLFPDFKGEPFLVVTFLDSREHTAAFLLNDLAATEIEFGVNSFRGDQVADLVRDEILGLL